MPPKAQLPPNGGRVVASGEFTAGSAHNHAGGGTYVTRDADPVAPLVALVDHGDPVVREMSGRLKLAGHTAVLVAPQTAAAAVARIVELSPDLVVLNCQAVGPGGLSVVRRLRQLLPLMPVVLVSPRADEAERISGLAAGADDFLPWPTSPVELVARVRAVLRRTQGQRASRPVPVLVAGPLVVDETRRRVEVFGEEAHLTLREFELLVFLMRHPEQPLRREVLLEQVWGYSFGEPSTVTVHIRRLRTKVEPDPGRPTAIRTAWGIGYLFDPAGPGAWRPVETTGRLEQHPLGGSDTDGGVDEPDMAHGLGEVAE
ncbi:MAG: response regulator transcription factor [Mycobacteriales bacterium]